jgi:hypothetical protein|tara:strand:- start:26670 stop:28712 length:2043 start_codon:yes stop_codon:yes gene_type:complete
VKNLKLFFILFLISSCGGGGGGGAPQIPFAITLASNSISIDEDTVYSGSLSATANEAVTLQYALVNSTTNGVLVFNADASIRYQPNSNYFGQDEFTYSVTAVEKNVTQTSTVNIEISAVNDAPQITMASKIDLDKNNLIFETNPIFEIYFSDVDSSDENFVFSARVNQNEVPASFTTTGDGLGNLQIDLSNLSTAGYFEVELFVSDGSASSSDTFSTWLIANKRVVTVAQDDDKSDGFDSGSTTNKDYYVYYLVGGDSSLGRTDYLFVADSLSKNSSGSSESDLDNFRDALLRSINRLNDSEIADFFQGYFDIIVAEPVNPDGTSLASIETGCYDWDEDVYCIGSNDINTSVFDDLYANNTLISVLTTISGRGVNLGNTNIQPIGTRTDYVLMHELGHAHGGMGDEYISDDDRDVSAYADRNVNTTTQSDPSLVKWKHHINDLTNVAGSTFKVCYNWSDGSVGLYDDVDPTTCDCLYNIYDASGNRTGRNPQCNQVGLFEGNYYGEFDNYRPKFLTVMQTNTDQYGEVNAEGFAIGSIQNQGFVDGDSVDFITDNTSTRTAFEIDIDVAYDSSKLKLKWYVNGVEDISRENQTNVAFDRPPDNSVQVYTWRVDDLTGSVIAPDDVTDFDDFYEGLFNSDFYWYDYESEQWGRNPTDRTQYDYGYVVGPMGGTWGINWERW